MIEIENYRIYNDDCIAVMDTLIKKGEQVDLVVTDPPYLKDSTFHKGTHSNPKFKKPILNEKNSELIKEAIQKIYTLLKDGCAFYCFCDWQHIDFFKKEIEKYFKIKNVLIWVKNNWTGGDLQGSYAKRTEFVIYATKGRHILNGRRDDNILEYKRVHGSKKVHQNQKPVDLIEYLIGKSSCEGGTVLDPFMGSGTTGVACRNTGRDFIGMELDDYYYTIAENRINNIE